MKTSPSRILAFGLLGALVLVASLPAMQKALGGSQVVAWINPRFLPVVLNNALPMPSTTPTLPPTATATPTSTEPPNPCATPPDTLTPTATPTGTPIFTASPTDTPTALATSTETPTLSATPICQLPSPTPASCSSTSALGCTPTPTHPPVFIPTGTYVPALKLTVAQSPLTIYPPIMIFTAKLMVLIPIPSTGMRVDFYNLVGYSLEYLGSGQIGNNGEALLNKQMCPGIYTTIARAEINNLALWSNPVTYTVH
jgi:hypothetical protein